jgi:hypothetical protein
VNPERRAVWTCIDCGLRVYNACGDPIRQPTRWKDERCPHCRVERARATDGNETAKGLSYRLGLSRRRQGFNKNGSGAPEQPDPKRKGVTKEEVERRKEQVRTAHAEHPAWTRKRVAEETGVALRTVARYWQDLELSDPVTPREPTPTPSPPGPPIDQRLERALRETVDSDKEISRCLAVDYGVVRDTRTALGIPSSTKRLHARRQGRVVAIVNEHPDWNNGRVAEAMGDLNAPVGQIRRELNLPRYKSGQGRRRRADQAPS